MPSDGQVEEAGEAAELADEGGPAAQRRQRVAGVRVDCHSEVKKRLPSRAQSP